jgi:pimeloyl-ACP methyl ester carboxylesterase
MDVSALPPLPLPPGIRSRIVSNINGLAIHFLESGFETKDRPCILLLHGFPELAYSWRKIMLPLAPAGYHVVAPDQRGYGRTAGWDDAYDGDLDAFRLPNLVRDALGLVSALGYRSVAAVIGHDFGSIVTAYCAVIRPDVFRSVVLMSAPFPGPPPLPFNTAEEAAQPVASTPSRDDVFQGLAKLDRPRKHYQQYYQTRDANDSMWKAPQGIHDFLRAYFHFKSADWKPNRPFKLSAFTATELAKMPTYYIMDLDKGMAETAAEQMPSAQEIATCRWFTDADLTVYAGEFARTGFQGGLQWYRCTFGGGKYTAELETLSGRTIDVPACLFRARAIGASIRPPVRLKEWKPTPAPNGAGPTWSMVRDTGYNRSSQRKLFGYCCGSSADKKEGTLPLWVIRDRSGVFRCLAHFRFAPKLTSDPYGEFVAMGHFRTCQTRPKCSPAMVAMGQGVMVE